MMSSRIVWIQLYRPAILILCSLPIPIRNGLDRSQRSMRLREAVVVVECQGYGAFRQSIPFGGREKAVITSKRVAIRQSGICQRIFWIFNNRFLKKRGRLFEAFLSALVPVIAALQIGFVRLAALGVGFGQLGLIRAG